MPRQYRNYDLDRGYKVVLNDYHGSRPYSNYRYDREKYYRGYGKPQESIGHRGDNHGNNGNYENRGNDGYNDHNKGRGKEGHGNEGRGNEGRGHEKK